MRDALAHTLYDLATRDPRVFVVVADIAPMSLRRFRDDFPNRFVNVGLAEASMIGVCAGLAMRGLKPFALTIATFAVYRPFEQIRDDLCYQNVSATVVGIGAGVAYSTLGATHQAQEDVAVLTALPNISILAPCDPRETEAATRACVERNGPTYLRLGKSGEPDLTSDAVEPFLFGKTRLLKRGERRCIIGFGPVLRLGFEAAALLEKEGGPPVAIVSVHTLKPLDRDGIAALLKRFEVVAVIEEHSLVGGLGSQVKQVAWDIGARCRLHTIALRDQFTNTFGTQGDLWRAHRISVEEICGRMSSDAPPPSDA